MTMYEIVYRKLVKEDLKQKNCFMCKEHTHIIPVFRKGAGSAMCIRKDTDKTIATSRIIFRYKVENKRYNGCARYVLNYQV